MNVLVPSVAGRIARRPPHRPAHRQTEALGRLLLLALLLLLPFIAFAQPAPHAIPPFDATSLREPTDLAGTWLVHAGDNPLYSRPDFDDADWTPFDPNTDISPLFHNARPEIVWYRLRVKVDPAQSSMALREESLSRAFEIFVNGEPLIASGHIAPYVPYTLQATLLKRIPDSLLASGSLVIALRVHISKREWNGQKPGYFPSNLALGQADALYQRDWLTVIGENLLTVLDTLLLVAVGLAALVLFAGQRGQKEYLWIGALGLIQLIELPFKIFSLFQNLPVDWEVLSKSFSFASPIVWVSMYFAFVRQRIGWRFRSFLLFAGLLNAYNRMQDLVPFLPGAWALIQNLPFVILLSIVMPVVLIVHLRRGNREAGILLIPVILFSLYIYAKYTLAFLFQIPAFQSAALRGLHLIDDSHFGPFVIGLNPLSGILSTISLAIIMLLRATLMSRRQALIEGELEAAQQVQQVLLPEHTESVPGFLVESVYRPARQVGGDFFQIVPTARNGLLLVVGDVAGKGLPAAMTVSLLVGAIRTAAEDTHDPELLLQKLNQRLVGRSAAGFSTALAAYFDSTGTVTIANAGHLPPYLDGHEIELPGALPLGVIGETKYETMHLHLPSGSRMTFYSDGVVEAQNRNMELFGFDRGREISTQSASAIVEAAIAFGQSDDITVVAITRGTPIEPPAGK